MGKSVEALARKEGYDMAARITLRGYGGWSTAGKRSIVAWLRSQVRTIEKDLAGNRIGGKTFSTRYFYKRRKK